MLLGDHGGELGAGLGADDLVEAAEVVFGVGAEQGRFADDPAASAFLAAASLHLVDGLPRGDDQKEPPEVVAVGELGKPPAHRPGAEAIERAQGGVLLVLVHTAAARRAELGAGDVDEPVEVTLPELLGSLVVPGLQRTDP